MSEDRWPQKRGHTGGSRAYPGAVLRRVLPLSALGLVAALTLTGCGAHDSTGQVSVHISDNAADHAYQVEVLLPSGELAEHQRLYPGDAADFAGVPLGDVTVRADDLCPQRATVSADRVATVTLTIVGC